MGGGGIGKGSRGGLYICDEKVTWPFMHPTQESRHQRRKESTIHHPVCISCDFKLYFLHFPAMLIVYRFNINIQWIKLPCGPGLWKNRTLYVTRRSEHCTMLKKIVIYVLWIIQISSFFHVIKRGIEEQSENNFFFFLNFFF